MGMDLVPRNPKVEGFHANWGGWSVIQVLLSFLEQDLTHMDGSNDGHRVPATDAQSWGRAVRTALEKGKLIVAETYDSSYSDKRKHWIIPRDKKALFERATDRAETGESSGTLLEAYLLMAIHFGKKRGDLLLEYKELDQDWKDFLMEFATFCEKSGGFQQC